MQCICKQSVVIPSSRGHSVLDSYVLHSDVLQCSVAVLCVPWTLATRAAHSIALTLCKQTLLAESEGAFITASVVPDTHEALQYRS
jgi:hypothetical protein